MATLIRSAPRALSRVTAQQPLAARSRAAPFLFKRGLATLPTEQPRLRLGSIAPNFKANTTQGEIDFHEWIGNSWAILFSHPADFTPVCTTELGAFAQLERQFRDRNVKMIGLSANDIGSHGQWIKDINEIDHTDLSFPIIGDADRNVAFLYDMISQEDLDNAGRDIAFTIRSVFIIDPAKKIRLTMMYPASTGRNSSEVLRVIDSLRMGDKYGVTTPINWEKGQDVIIPPSVSTEAAIEKYGKDNVREVKPYLRFTPDPKESVKLAKDAERMRPVCSNPVSIYQQMSKKEFTLAAIVSSPKRAAKFLGMSLPFVTKHMMSREVIEAHGERYKLSSGPSVQKDMKDLPRLLR